MTSLIFDSCESFANFLDTTVKMRLAAIPAMELAAQEVEKAAKQELGTYQKRNMGPFKAWKELSPSTKETRRRLQSTYGINAPLLREGELRNSISHETDKSGLEAVIGSPLDKALYLELGTKNMAPRSFLGLAAYRKRKKIIKLVGGLTVCAMLNVDFRNFGSYVFKHEGED